MKAIAIGCAIPLIGGVVGAMIAYQFLPNSAGGAFGFLLGFIPSSAFGIWLCKRLGTNDHDDNEFLSPHS